MGVISQGGPEKNSILYQNLVTRNDNYAYVTAKDWIDEIDEGGTVYEYTYDANGNITSDGRHSYVYNEQNQLYRVMDGQAVLGEYTYNAKGQRVKKVASCTTIYHYDLIGNLIQETDASGNVIASYVYAWTYRIAKVEPSGTIYYYHNDHLGTPLAMTDTSGTIVWKAAYNPFGKAEVDQSSTVTNNFRFPGQYYDSESGLHYNWHRYYDPGTGRYMTADPVGQKGGINLFGYVGNNPVNIIDPIGLVSCDGYWRMENWDRVFNFVCVCYWLCIPCEGTTIWGGNYMTLPSTWGQMVYKGGGGLKSGDTCFCAKKPGPEKDCRECPKS